MLKLNRATPSVRPVAAELVHAGKSFGARRILDGVDLRVRRGEFVALLGASGSGKTTLLRVLLGLERLDFGSGRVATPGSVVFQEPRLIPSQRVWSNVLLGLRLGAASKSVALQALAEVGLESHADVWPATLSGGEAQRVALARALIREPQLLLLDEPFAALDALTRLKMQDLVRQLCHRHEPGVLLVTHDVDEAIRMADRILILKDGRLTVDVQLNPGSAVAEDDEAMLAQTRARLFEELGVKPDRVNYADDSQGETGA